MSAVDDMLVLDDAIVKASREAYDLRLKISVLEANHQTINMKLVEKKAILEKAFALLDTLRASDMVDLEEFKYSRLVLYNAQEIWLEAKNNVIDSANKLENAQKQLANVQDTLKVLEAKRNEFGEVINYVPRG